MSKKEKVLDKIKELVSERKKIANKQAKRLAMKNNVKLGELRKEFCQKCFSPLEGRLRIKNKYKIITCKHCGKLTRTKIS